MSVYQFKLPDIGEGIAEAEIVAWHVKVGDKVEEDQQLADMMTDKATVEMESPVAGMVKSLAGEVGDQIAIGSVLVEIETEGDAPAAAAAGARRGERDGTAAAPTARKCRRRSRKRRFRSWRRRPSRACACPGAQGRAQARARTGRAHGAKVLASPAVRQRARDLGIDLGEVKTASDRIRHADLDAYLLYNGGSVSGRGAAPARRRDDQGRRPAPQDRREYAGGEAPHPALHAGRGIRRHRARRNAGDDERATAATIPS